MAEPFLGEIRLFGFNFAPKGWTQCNGQLLPINQNQALFSLLGTTFGGNGQTTFALPDLRGRVPLHRGNGSGRPLGESGGEQSHTLAISELPTHAHRLVANTSQPANPGGQTPTGTSRLSRSSPGNLYGGPLNLAAMSPSAVSNTGGSEAHPNMQPYLTILFCIALQGIFPSRN